MSNFKLLLQRQSLQSRRDCECSVEGTVNSNGTGQTDAQASIFYTAEPAIRSRQPDRYCLLIAAAALFILFTAAAGAWIVWINFTGTAAHRSLGH